MTILDVITSSPINVFFTIVIGLGLAYLYCRKPSSSSSSASSTGTQSSALHRNHFPTRYIQYHSGSLVTGTDNNGGAIVDEELQRAIAQIERQERDMIRQEQDEAYQQSLKADREKRLKKEEEQKTREAKEKAEREQREQRERLHQRLTKLRSEIADKLPVISSQTTPAEPGDEIVKLVFKLPDGTRVKQDFRRRDRVKYLHWFVFSLKNAPLQFKMTTNFPKRDVPGRPPIPEDFETETTTLPEQQQLKNHHHHQSELRDPNDTAETTRTTTPPNSKNISSSSSSSPLAPAATIEPNCELTLAEAGLTETQILFVYDLEA